MKKTLNWDGAPRDIQIMGPRFKIRLKYVLKIIKQPRKMLEIGAGNGNMASYYQKYVKDLTLSDISQKSITYLKSRFSDKKISFKKYNILKDKINEKFDFILLSEVLEHIKEDKLMLNNISKLLNKKGKLLITVPANEKYRNVEDEVAGHIRRYNYLDIKKKIEKHFKIITFIGWGYPIMIHYYKYYNNKYYSLDNHKQSKIKLRFIEIATEIIFFVESFFSKKFNNSLGFIILAEKK